MPLIPTRAGRRRRHTVPTRVYLFIAGLALVALAVCVTVIREARPIQVDHSLPWVLVALALVGAEYVPVKFHSAGHTLNVDMFGVPMLVGAVFLSPADLLIAVSTAALATSILQREPVERSVFNVLNQTTAVGLARLVLGAVLAGGRPVAVPGWGALFLALVSYEVATALGILLVVSLNSGAPGWTYVRNLAWHVGLTLPINAALGIVAVTVAWTQGWAILLLAGPGVLLALWYRAANSVRTRYANLQLLYGFTVALAGLSETDQVITAALGEVRRLLHAGGVELCLPTRGGTLRCAMDDNGKLRKTLGELTPLEQEVVTGFETKATPKGRRERAGGGLLDRMAAPVKLGNLGVAVLTVAIHEDGDETFDSEDLRLFGAIAAHLSTALTSSQLLEHLRLEVAAREHEALHDSLTGLANRVLFSQWASDAIEGRPNDQMVAVLLMDLDGFKDINDTLGHVKGDTILKEVSGRVLAAVGSDRLAARLGGDEFAFVIPAADSPEEIVAAAETILESVSRPIAIDGLVLELRASIGIAAAPQDGHDASSLLQRADVAMYSAKRTKRRVVAYDRDLDRNTKRRLVLTAELRRAMETKDLEVWYQPVARMDTGEIVGLEALSRWRHREFGWISPDEFIPVAEATGLIEPLTWWVLESALREVHQWHLEGFELTMAVNISARSLLGPEIVDRLGRIMEDARVPPGSVILEITESLMMVDPEWSERILAQLSDLGVTIAIDDFGTGYSSLSRLKRLPVKMVKIDRSFVINMQSDDSNRAIVQATIELARAMGHHVVAEGAERREAWDALKAMGCDHVQGHYLAKAMPAEECREWLARYQAPGMAPVRNLPFLAHGA